MLHLILREGASDLQLHNQIGMPQSQSNTRAQPWKAHWPPQAQDVRENMVAGFKKGETIIQGGVAGSFKTIRYDTSKAEATRADHDKPS